MRSKPHLAQPKTEHKPEPVTTIKVDPLVWAFALDSAGGDTSRIDIISSTHVVVRNKGSIRVL